jgi:hypothetical protein
MATLGDPDEFGPFPEVETKYGWGPGLIWLPKERTNYTYRVTWPIDNTGGEAPPSTWTVGAATYRLRSAGPERAYGKATGLYTAVYWLKGASWSWVT